MSATTKLRDLIAGKGPDRVRLTLAEIDAKGDGGCRDELASVLKAHPDIGYAHDPFLDRWTLWRPAAADLFTRQR